MRNDFLTDEQVEQEIERLSQSLAVKLARKEARIKYRRRQTMYTLRQLEKRGEQLMMKGTQLTTSKAPYSPKFTKNRANGWNGIPIKTRRSRYTEA